MGVAVADYDNDGREDVLHYGGQTAIVCFITWATGSSPT